MQKIKTYDYGKKPLQQENKNIRIEIKFLNFFIFINI